MKIESLERVVNMNRHYAKANMTGISAERMTVVPAGVQTHPAWILGHIAVCDERAAVRLGAEAALPEGWMELFGLGSTPEAESGRYPQKEELAAAYNQQQAQLLELTKQASDAALAKPLDIEGLNRILPTVGDMAVALLTTHEGIHLGQLSVWRRAMGMPLPV